MTGTGYVGKAAVSIVLTQGSRSWILAKVTTSSTGGFQTTVTMPAGVTGTVTISTTGGTPAGCVIDPILITISASGAGGGGGTPASTGVDVQTLLVIAGMLLALGTPLAITRRRRHHRPVHRRRRGTGPAVFLAPHRAWDATT